MESVDLFPCSGHSLTGWLVKVLGQSSLRKFTRRNDRNVSNKIRFNQQRLFLRLLLDNTSASSRSLFPSLLQFCPVVSLKMHAVRRCVPRASSSIRGYATSSSPYASTNMN